MTRNKWFVSDTHFFHTNILKFVDDKGHRIRPFSSLEEMHETIVERWNSLVKDNDFVYHLGDVTFQYHRPFQELMHRLKGDKRLIVGNHDKLKQEGLLKCFSKVMYWHGFKEGNFTASHVPHILESLRDGAFNVHGHTHQNSLQDPHYLNVCVEVRDYYPVNYDTILSEIKSAGLDTKKGKKMTITEQMTEAHAEIDPFPGMEIRAEATAAVQTDDLVGTETPETQVN